MSSPIISIVVSGGASPHHVRATLDALKAHDTRPSLFEFIIIKEMDGTDEWLSQMKWEHPVSVIKRHGPPGRSGSYNTGWSAAAGQWVIFLDCGAVPMPDWIRETLDLITTTSAEVIIGKTRRLSPLYSAGYASDADGGGTQNDDDTPLLPSDSFCVLNSDSDGRDYWDVGSHLMLTRSVLDRCNGFASLLTKGAAIDFIIRAAEAGSSIVWSDRCWVYESTLPSPDLIVWTKAQRLGLAYRAPYSLPTLLNMLMPRADARVSPTQVCTENMCLADLFVPDEMPGDFVYSERRLAGHFSEMAGLESGVAASYLQDSIAGGLIATLAGDTRTFDLYHTDNWLRKRTLYNDALLTNASYARTHPTAAMEGNPSDTPLAINCSGRYALCFDLDGWLPDNLPTFNLSLPTEHFCQTNVKLIRFFPPELEEYMDSANGIIANCPGSLMTRNHGSVGYEFECIVVERFRHVGSDLSEVPLLKPRNSRFSFPALCKLRTQQLLDLILCTERSARPEKIAARVYSWILENVSYAISPMADHAILETGIGTCVQMVRLFANFMRLAGIPVREQCGALMARATSQNEIMSTGVEYSPFAHTWAEVHLEPWGWCPVEFIAMQYGRWNVSTTNVSERLREEMFNQTARLSNYYFGSIDPYRIYTNNLANRVPPVFTSGNEPDPQTYVRKHVRHRLACVNQVSGICSSWSSEMSGGRSSKV